MEIKLKERHTERFEKVTEWDGKVCVREGEREINRVTERKKGVWERWKRQRRRDGRNDGRNGKN